MRKLAQVLSLFLVVIALLGSSQAAYDGILLKDYPHYSPLKGMLLLQADDVVNEIILLPEVDFDVSEVAAIIKNVRRLPPSLLDKIHHEKIYLKLFVGNLTDNRTASHLKGMIPRGYEGDTLWDNVPGIGGGQVVLVKIGHSHIGMGHGSINLELHELAHSIDRIVFNHLRFDPLFQSIWYEEKYELFPGRTYLLSLPEEYFAESFAMYYLDQVSNAILKEKAPKTYEYIKNLK